MNCGQEIRVKDAYGTVMVQFIAQCEDMFLIITRSPLHMNGYRLVGWHPVLRELVALTVPAKLIEKTMTAEGTASGQYVNIPLTYPLSAGGLARLLDVPTEAVRAQLADLAIEVDT